MSYVFDWSSKKSKALWLLKGAPLSTLIAYTLYADDYGNSWASSTPKRGGALNRTTGLSHGAIAGKNGARQFLLDHECIEVVPFETAKKLYADKPLRRKPPVNAAVYHITKRIQKCSKSSCECHKLLQVVEGEDLYIFYTSTETGHEVSPVEF